VRASSILVQGLVLSSDLLSNARAMPTNRKINKGSRVDSTPLLMGAAWWFLGTDCLMKIERNSRGRGRGLW